MDTNQVVQKILNEAKAEADKIKAQADEQLSILNAETQNKLACFEQETAELCGKAAKDSKDKILAQMRMAVKKQETETKRMIINKVIAKSADKIKSMNEAEYLSLMEGLILASVKTGSEELIVDRNEKRINDDFVRRVNQKLSGKGNLHLASERADIGAGFILREGKRQVNASLDVLLKAAAQELEGRLAQILFG